MAIYSKEYLKRWINCLFPVFTLCALFFLFIPISTIQDNQRFLNVTPDKVWLTLLLITIGLTLVFTSIAAIFKKKIGMVFVSILAGIILASFVQMLFLDSELGVLNGSYPAWKSNTGKIILNSIIWIILITLPVIISLLKKGIHSLLVTAICLAVLSSQTVSVGSIALSGNAKSLNEISYVLNGKDQYKVSKNENILVFSLDTLSKDIFELIIFQDEEVAEGLKDFTYFSNTCGIYSTTFPTLVGLLTGTEYLGDVSYKDYFSRSWNSDFTNTFYPVLHENGYKINLFMDEYLAEESGDLIGKADNIIRAKKQIRPILFARLLRISLYRLLPFCLKEYALITPQGTVMTADLLNKSVDIIPVQDSQEKYEPIRKDITFYDELNNRGIELENNNIFAWTHLMGAHSPYVNDARCEPVVNGSPIEQATGYLFALEQYFNHMKEVGAYENATIIITADHGVDPSINESYSLFVPIIIKCPGETHDSMLINDAPLSLKDISPTLFSFVNSDGPQFGKTIFDYCGEEQRERILRRFGKVDEFNTNSWTEESNGSYNALVEYCFVGGQDDLNQKIDLNDYKAIPLVDSFY